MTGTYHIALDLVKAIRGNVLGMTHTVENGKVGNGSQTTANTEILRVNRPESVWEITH
eukprot:CAMPEP_0175024010 /NCGR_PEP_ID=MMETSP0005-20121125/16190_1 /TAXON_ID=420556 /ORGANISM="Ochromonas sp., Strain CCMP1393" /LENGTH=57 /DNA_ID=CAMNT_0016282437 /DNA_START=1 /DNA_END=174 /DNA_ORIENTATION=-